MICAYCGAPLEDGTILCPFCGHETSSGAVPEDTAAENTGIPADNPPETAAEEASALPEESPAASEEAPAAPEENDSEDASEPAEPVPAESGEKKGKEPHHGLLLGLVIGLSLVCVALIVLIAVRYFGGKKASKPAGTAVPDAPASTPAAESGSQDSGDAAVAEEEPVFGSVSYQQPDAGYFTEAVLNTPVASCGSTTLTNRDFAFYYWQSFYSMLSYYGSNISYIMDPYSRLDSQFVDEDYTIDQYLAELALDSFGSYARFYEEAAADGYELNGDDLQILDDLRAQLAEDAAQAGFASADEYVQKSFGPYCSVDDYMDYMKIYVTVSSYVNDRFNSLTFSDEELSAFYDENAASYSSIQKLDKPNVNIRHILIIPGEVSLSADDEGYEAAVQAAKSEALSKAEEIYAEWQSGEMTEDSFAELAGQHSQDPGSVGSGGLYSDVAPGEMVPSFNDWCFEDGRDVGDHGIVETDYGYHIMFFSGTTDTVNWKERMTSAMRTAAYKETSAALQEEKPVLPALENAAVYPRNLMEG